MYTVYIQSGPWSLITKQAAHTWEVDNGVLKLFRADRSAVAVFKEWVYFTYEPAK